MIDNFALDVFTNYRESELLFRRPLNFFLLFWVFDGLMRIWHFLPLSNCYLILSPPRLQNVQHWNINIKLPTLPESFTNQNITSVDFLNYSRLLIMGLCYTVYIAIQLYSPCCIIQFKFI